jgi:hypothetical protein
MAEEQGGFICMKMSFSSPCKTFQNINSLDLITGALMTRGHWVMKIVPVLTGSILETDDVVPGRERVTIDRTGMEGQIVCLGL